MRCGDTDPNKVYYRSDSRIFRMNEQWFFASREGDQGPYFTECEAKAELARHVAASQVLTPLKTKAIEVRALEIPDISEAPVVAAEFGKRNTMPETRDPYLEDISEFQNSSLRAYRERYSR